MIIAIIAIVTFALNCGIVWFVYRASHNPCGEEFPHIWLDTKESQEEQ